MSKAVAFGAGASILGFGAVLAYYYANLPQGPKGQTIDVDDPPDEYDENWRLVPDRDLSEYGDNWGSTPKDLIPYFQAVEENSGIPGSGRVFSLIAYGESRWVPTAHNNDAREVAGSRDSFAKAQANFPTLKHGKAAADFGSGGLYGMLGPIYLWTGAVYGRGSALLLDQHPRAMFDIRNAGFAAIVFMNGLLKNRDVRDVVDIKVGWGRPARLANRDGDPYKNARAKFWAQSIEAGIDLEDRATIPPTLDASGFPGVRTVYRKMMEL